MAVKQSFASVPQNRLSRDFGSTIAGTADPYVTGYHFIYFSKLPPTLSNYLPSGALDSKMSVGEMGNLLSGACLSVTPPGGTLNRVEYTGLGGIKWAVPGSVDYGNTVSVKFLEFNGHPILNIFHGWVKMIRDYRSGTTHLEEGGELDGYSKRTYGGIMYYWTTSPDVRAVEYYACYDGIFPLKDPQDLFASDVETVGRLDVEIEFNVDYVWHENWVYDNCQKKAMEVFKMKKMVEEEYGKTVAGTGPGGA